MNFGNRLSKETTDFRLMMNMYAYKNPDILSHLMNEIKQNSFVGINTEITFDQSPCSHIIITLTNNNNFITSHEVYMNIYNAVSRFFNSINTKKALRQIIETNYNENDKLFLLSALDKVGTDKHYTSAMFSVSLPDIEHVYIYI